MAEKEQSHRTSTERAALNASVRDALLGKYLGSAIAGIAIIGAILIVYWDGPAAVAVALVSVPVFGAIRALISSRNKEEE